MKLKRLLSAVLIGLVAVFSAEWARQLAEKDNPHADRDPICKY